MTMVATYQQPDFLDPMECPPVMDHGSRRVEAFDVDELIRRLEMHRQELKMSQVRARTEALKGNKRLSMQSYAPRYGSGSSKDGESSYKLDKSRRQTRVFEFEKPDSAGDDDTSSRVSGSSQRSNPSKGQSKRDSGWTNNPKSSFVLRERPATAIMPVVDHEPTPRNDSDPFNHNPHLDEEAQRKKQNRRSVAIFESARTSPSKMYREPSPLQQNGRQSRPVSLAVGDWTMDWRRGAANMPNAYGSVATVAANPEAEREAELRNARRRSWLPPKEDRNDWSQADEHAAPIERESWKQKIARRRSRVLPAGSVSRPGTSAGLMVMPESVESHPAPVPPTRPTTRSGLLGMLSKSGEGEKQGTKRPGPFARDSAESVAGLAKRKDEEKGKKMKKSRSLFDLFRRHRD